MLEMPPPDHRDVSLRKETELRVPVADVSTPSVVRRNSERTLEVNGRDWPAVFEFNDIDMPGVAHSIRRARVMFEGAMVSVVWGSCTYSDNHDHGIMGQDELVEEPERVEVGVWVESDGHLEVLAYVPAIDLAMILEWVAGGGRVETMVEAWQRSGRPMG